MKNSSTIQIDFYINVFFMIRRGEYNFEISKILVHSNLENFARPLMHRFFLHSIFFSIFLSILSLHYLLSSLELSDACCKASFSCCKATRSSENPVSCLKSLIDPMEKQLCKGENTIVFYGPGKDGSICVSTKMQNKSNNKY